MLEKIIQKSIITLIHKRGGYCVKVQSATRNGVPDVLACYKGVFVGIECKTPLGKLSELQTHNLEMINKANGHIVIARAVEDVEEKLNEIDMAQGKNGRYYSESNISTVFAEKWMDFE